jgi:hypothetical protein
VPVKPISWPKVGGRPSFEPTESQRALVTVLSSVGITQQTIARKLNIDAKTLRRYFKAEMANGAEDVKAVVLAGLAQRAMKGDNTCAIFMAKTRYGWKEKRDDPPDEAGESVVVTIKGGLPD